ncbi:MAG: hypothetical protein U1C71_00810, partial [archaeon]|nr:hypothetical protein [archaeon]
MDTLEVLEEGIAPRFSLNGKPEPNFEVNYATSKYAGYSLEKRIPIWLKGRLLYTSEIELQIAYKWYLGTEKDF